MRNIFFFEKHPPLGKQLVASVASLAGYDGNFTFNKIGSEYTMASYLSLSCKNIDSQEGTKKK
jgi:dolichyl-phosphate-mannose--protein O-mannosyl transferase